MEENPRQKCTEAENKMQQRDQDNGRGPGLAG